MSLISSIFGGFTAAAPPKPPVPEPVSEPVPKQVAEAVSDVDTGTTLAEDRNKDASSGDTAQDDKAQTQTAAQSSAPRPSQSTNAGEVASQKAAQLKSARAEPALAPEPTDEARARVAAERRIEAAQARILIDQIAPVSNVPQSFKSYMSSLLGPDTTEASTQGAADMRTAA